MKYTIRQEKPGDEAAIARITEAAFAGKPYADGDEHLLPERLRAAGALVLSLVAVARGEIVGHAALSPARVDAAKWLTLGPVSVRPDAQGQGIGSSLVNHAVAVAQAYGRDGCLLTGDPKFYGRLGFELAPEMTLDGKPSAHLQIIRFTDAPAKGDVRFHPVFYA